MLCVGNALVAQVLSPFLLESNFTTSPVREHLFKNKITKLLFISISLKTQLVVKLHTIVTHNSMENFQSFSFY